MSESPTRYVVTRFLPDGPFGGPETTRWLFDACEFEKAHALFESLDVEGDGSSVAWEVNY
jgi:hypothetical protein